MIKLCNSCGKKVLLLPLFSLLIILITTLLSTSLTNQHQTITIAQTNDDINTFRIYENPTYGIQIQYLSDWGRLDLSFLQDSADIDFYPLSDTSLAKNVKLQVKNLPFHNMTLEEYTNSQINPTEEILLESNTTTLADLPGYKKVSSTPKTDGSSIKYMF